MNELIDEIAFEAGCHRHKYYDPKHPDLEGYIISQEALDNFARLVVEGCAKHIDSMHNGNFHAIADELKQHFGFR